jgi:hypothetical protein
LHIEEAFASIHWDQGPIEPIATGVRTLASCPYFNLEWCRWERSVTLGGLGRLQTLMIIEGQGRFHNGEFCMPGDVWVLDGDPKSRARFTLTLTTCTPKYTARDRLVIWADQVLPAPAADEPTSKVPGAQARTAP